MKSLALIMIYTCTFLGMFFFLSSIGLLWNNSYGGIISDPTWFMLYTLFLGWWIAIFPTREYYMHHEKYFQDYI